MKSNGMFAKAVDQLRLEFCLLNVDELVGRSGKRRVGIKVKKGSHIILLISCRRLYAAGQEARKLTILYAQQQNKPKANLFW